MVDFVSIYFLPKLGIYIGIGIFATALLSWEIRNILDPILIFLLATIGHVTVLISELIFSKNAASLDYILFYIAMLATMGFVSFCLREEPAWKQGSIKTRTPLENDNQTAVVMAVVALLGIGLLCHVLFSFAMAGGGSRLDLRKQHIVLDLLRRDLIILGLMTLGALISEMKNTNSAWLRPTLIGTSVFLVIHLATDNTGNKALILFNLTWLACGYFIFGLQRFSPRLQIVTFLFVLIAFVAFASLVGHDRVFLRLFGFGDAFLMGLSQMDYGILSHEIDILRYLLDPVYRAFGDRGSPFVLGNVIQQFIDELPQSGGPNSPLVLLLFINGNIGPFLSLVLGSSVGLILVSARLLGLLFLDESRPTARMRLLAIHGGAFAILIIPQIIVDIGTTHQMMLGLVLALTVAMIASEVYLVLKRQKKSRPSKGRPIFKQPKDQ